MVGNHKVRREFRRVLLLITTPIRDSNLPDNGLVLLAQTTALAVSSAVQGTDINHETFYSFIKTKFPPINSVTKRENIIKSAIELDHY